MKPIPQYAPPNKAGFRVAIKFAVACAISFAFAQSSFGVTYPAANSTNFPSGSFDDGSVDEQGNPTPMHYRYFIPKNYDAEDTETLYPLVLFLHGAGEKGTNNQKQLSNNANGAMIFISSANPDNQTDYPCFWVAPQAYGGDWRTGTKPAQVQGILDELIANYHIDPNRIYLTGLSMGGNGVMSQLLNYPERYAAANENCGWLGASSAAGIEHIPLWAFHCANDNTVLVSGSDNIVGNMRDLGGKPIYTRYETGGHSGAWSRAYNPATPLVPWMMAQRRGQPPVANIGPYVQVNSPASRHVSTNADSYAITGEAAENTISVSYRNAQFWNDVTPTINGTTSWDVTISPLREGRSNEIYVEAEIENYVAPGNGTTTANAYLYINSVAPGGDATQPALNISQPIADPIYLSYGNSIQLAGTVSDNTAVTSLTWQNSRGGNDNIAISESWAYPDLPLQEGLNIITVTALDAANNVSEQQILIEAIINQAPIVDAGEDQAAVLLTAGATLSGIVSDDGVSPGNTFPILTWSQLSGPGTASFGNANSAITSVNFTDEGTYVLELSATDGELTTTDTITLSVVTELPPRTILYDFGTQSLPSGHWNLVRYAGLGDEVLNAIDTNGAPTDIDLVFTNAFKGRNTEGPSGTGLYPDEATTDSYNVNNANRGEFRFEDLDPNKTYSIKIFASAAFDSANDSVGIYTIGSTTLTLDATDNTTQTISFENITPDTSGHIALSIAATDDSGEAFINVLELIEYSAAPTNLAPIAVDDSVWVAIDSVVIIDALLNDSDPDEGPTPLTISVINDPANGSAELSDGKIQYEPNLGFTGVDSFGYTITDGTDTSSALVYVDVLTPYNAWTKLYNLEGDDALPIEDPDHDGITNFMERGFGQSPLSPDVSGLIFSRIQYDDGTPFLYIEFNRNSLIGDLRYTVKESTDLSEWHEIGRHELGINYGSAFVSESDNGTDRKRLEFKTPLPAESEPSFIRVELESIE
ncbi:Ig-like domain-containing protein [Cerasicoccus frondis]|uniref:Ig-like domain-containing protein n=1 Tax=Cerasicoccus frondis TaxID=490090 RepID=UPI00285250DF|nr:Ig-like domain-containing protein [Cerasicoccus frondis]